MLKLIVIFMPVSGRGLIRASELVIKTARTAASHRVRAKRPTSQSTTSSRAMLPTSRPRIRRGMYEFMRYESEALKPLESLGLMVPGKCTHNTLQHIYERLVSAQL